MQNPLKVYPRNGPRGNIAWSEGGRVVIGRGRQVGKKKGVGVIMGEKEGRSRGNQVNERDGR